MDSGAKVKRKINPRENANFLSVFLFTFALKTIRKGVKRDLNTEDVYEVLRDYRSEKLGKRLDDMWKLELKKKHPCIVKPLARMFGVTYLALSVIMLINESTLLYLKPLLIGKVVSYYTPNTTTTRQDAIWYSLGLVGCVYFFHFWDHTFLLCLQQIFLKIRIACTSLIYRKCMKLDLSTSHQFASGMAVTLITKDLNVFDAGLDFLNVVICESVQLVVLFVVTYRQIGISAVFATMFLFSIYPIHGYLCYKIAQIRLRTSKFTDKRVRITQEILTAIRIIKMYTWEMFFKKSVDDVRKKEIGNLRLLYYLHACVSSIGQLSSQVALYICVISFAGFGNYISAEKAFVVIGTFGSVRDILSGGIPSGIAVLAELKACIERLTNFLMLDEVSPHKNIKYVSDETRRVLLENVSVESEDGSTVLDDVNLCFQEGLTAITGNVGVGKSSLLKTILGDVHIKHGCVTVSGEVSYASQEPWIFPGTVKQNILFGESFDMERYRTIVEICALKRDFDAFSAGDQTYVTDKGLNLSRGQKTRINLARAIYRRADIYLLDDCLSSVDTHVAKHIFNRCIKEFLKSKVCVLVTQKSQVLQEVDRVVNLGEGVVVLSGNIRNVVKDPLESFQEIEETKSFDEYDEPVPAENVNETSCLKKDMTENIYEEHNEQGTVKLANYLNYLKHGGGYVMLVLIISLFILFQVASSWSDFFVSTWVDIQQELSDHRFNQSTYTKEYKQLEDRHDNHLKNYSAIILVAALLVLLRAFAFYIFISRASVNIHRIILNKILNAKILFFDQNLSGNVLNRFSRDLAIIDEKLPGSIFSVIDTTLTLLGILFVVTSVNLFFLIPSLIFLTILIIARHLYMPTGRSIRRLEGATRSPLIGHLNSSLEGLTTIRACKTQEILIKEFDQHQDFYSSASYMNISTTKGFAFYLEALASVYITTITLSFLFIKTETLAGQVGLAITQSFSLNRLLQWVIRHWAELENQMTSTERVLEYTKIDTEDKSGRNLVDWPKFGRIVYDDVTLRYSPNSPKVLNNITFTVEASQKIGIVGRTGAGKSSLIATLFKLYDYEGSITIDNSDIDKLDVGMVRSKISIIPQDPVLFSDTVRNNLDPKKEHTEEDLWRALEEVDMKVFIKSLDVEIKEGGSNYSVGQRQLLSLARAMLSRNAILVMDEATANVDPETDELITRTIKKKFSNITVITIAHNLRNVMDVDKVLVMDMGCILEYASPKELLGDESSSFYKMVKEANLL